MLELIFFYFVTWQPDLHLQLVFQVRRYLFRPP